MKLKKFYSIIVLIQRRNDNPTSRIRKESQIQVNPCQQLLIRCSVHINSEHAIKTDQTDVLNLSNNRRQINQSTWIVKQSVYLHLKTCFVTNYSRVATVLFRTNEDNYLARRVKRLFLFYHYFVFLFRFLFLFFYSLYINMPNNLSTLVKS